MDGVALGIGVGIADAVIELTGMLSETDIAGTGDDMSFTFEVIDGELPQGAIGTASLLIDRENFVDVGTTVVVAPY